MILAGENIDIKIIRTLREKGYIVLSIFENNRGISDENVIRIAIEKNYILLTEDKDFGEWVYAHKIDNLSVILLRYQYLEIDKIIDVILELFEKKSDNLFGKFITVTKNKIRIREI